MVSYPAVVGFLFVHHEQIIPNCFDDAEVSTPGKPIHDRWCFIVFVYPVTDWQHIWDHYHAKSKLVANQSLFIWSCMMHQKSYTTFLCSEFHQSYQILTVI